MVIKYAQLVMAIKNYKAKLIAFFYKITLKNGKMCKSNIKTYEKM